MGRRRATSSVRHSTIFPWAHKLSDGDIRKLIAQNIGRPFTELYRERFGVRNPPTELNSDQRMMIVCTDTDEATRRILDYLTERHRMDINVVTLSYYKLDDQELIARTWLVDPAELEERIGVDATDREATDAERAWTGLWHVNAGIDTTAGAGRMHDAMAF